MSKCYNCSGQGVVPIVVGYGPAVRLEPCSECSSVSVTLNADASEYIESRRWIVTQICDRVAGGRGVGG